MTSPYNVGDVIGTDGVLFDISGDNLSGKVVYYKNTAGTNVAFSSDSTLVLDPEKSSLEDGQANVEYLRSIDPTLEKFPAVKACDDYEGDWYLPAINELKSLFETYNGTTVDVATYATYTNLSGPEKEARVAFNTKLTGLGGHRLDLSTNAAKGTGQWSSSLSESDGSKAQYLRWSAVTTGSTLLSSANWRARCIKKVNFADLQNSTEE